MMEEKMHESQSQHQDNKKYRRKIGDLEDEITAFQQERENWQKEISWVQRGREMEYLKFYIFSVRNMVFVFLEQYLKLIFLSRFQSVTDWAWSIVSILAHSLCTHSHDSYGTVYTVDCRNFAYSMSLNLQSGSSWDFKSDFYGNSQNIALERWRQYSSWTVTVYYFSNKSETTLSSRIYEHILIVLLFRWGEAAGEEL